MNPVAPKTVRSYSRRGVEALAELFFAAVDGRFLVGDVPVFVVVRAEVDRVEVFFAGAFAAPVAFFARFLGADAAGDGELDAVFFAGAIRHRNVGRIGSPRCAVRLPDGDDQDTAASRSVSASVHPAGGMIRAHARALLLP